MSPKAINLKAKFDCFRDYWSPRVIAELNGYQFKLVKASGEFVWHSHADTDEAFVVVEGTLEIEFRDHTVTINAGEMIVVPRGVEHRPIAREECKIMLLEPRGVVNTGDAGGGLTAQNDVWI